MTTQPISRIIFFSCLTLGTGLLLWTLAERVKPTKQNDRLKTDNSTQEQAQPDETVRNPDPDSTYNRPLKVGEEVVLVEIADTPEKQVQGLSGRKELPEGRGMLFLFKQADVLTFWMPNMNFPIDILYIRSNREYTNPTQIYKSGEPLVGTISRIYDRVPNPPLDTPRDQLERYSSVEPADMVLEVPAGWSQAHGVSVGTVIELQDR